MFRMQQFKSCHVFCVFFLLIFLIEGKCAHAQAVHWSQVNGLNGGRIESLLAAPDGTLYVSTRDFGNIFRSQDKGASWESIRYNLPESDIVLSLAIQDSKLFASLPFVGVFGLEEGSKQWVARDNGLPDEEFGALTATDQALYVGVANYGYFVSYDGGEAWEYASEGVPLTNRYFDPIVVKDNVLYVGQDEQGVYRSVDDGETWQSYRNGIPEFVEINLVFASENDVYISVESNGLMRLEGDTWEFIEGAGFPDRFHVTAMHQMGGFLYAAIVDIADLKKAIYRSGDDGETWKLVSNVLPDNDHEAFASIGDELFVGLDGAGVFYSKDQGVKWESANNGFIATHVTDVLVFNDVLYASTEKSGIFRSDDGGMTWTLFPETMGQPIGNLMVFGHKLYASNLDLMVLEEDGSAWTYINRIPDNPLLSKYVVGIDDVLFVSTRDAKLLRSDDFGQNWELIDNNIFIYSLFARDDTLLVGKLVGGVYKMGLSDDHLMPANLGVENTTPYDFLFSDERLYMATSDGVYYTEDLGETWQPLGSPRFVYSIALHDSTFYSGTDVGGVYRLNADDAWDVVAEGLPERLRITTLASVGDNVFAGSHGNGLYKATVQAIPEVLLLASADTLQFGEQPIETVSSQTVTVSNLGSQVLTVSEIALNGPDAFQFSVVPQELTLQPGESQIVTVTFSPISLSDAGPTYLVMTHNGENSPTTVVLSGVGVMQTRLLLDSVTGKPGDRIEMPVTVEFATGIAGGDLIVYYNPFTLTAVEVQNGPMIDEADMTVIPNLNSEGQIRIAMAGAGIINSSHGTLLTLIFDINEDAFDTTEHLHFEAFVKGMDGAALSSTTTSGSVTVDVDVLGDVNNDDLVDAGDAIQVLRHSAGVSTLTTPHVEQADVNGDQAVDSGDAVLILRKAVGLIDRFPGEAASKLVLAVGDLPKSKAVVLGDIEQTGNGVVIPLLIESDVMGSDLTIQYDPTLYQNPQLTSRGNALFVTNDHKGEFDVSFVRSEAHDDDVFELRLDALYDQGTQESPIEVHLSGKVFDASGFAVGTLAQLRAGVQKQVLRAYPNPFNPSSTLHYTIPTDGNVQLVVYNQMGQVVRTLVSDWQSQGIYQVAWDGRDALGREVASGLYIGRLQTQSSTQEMKLLLLK